MHRKKLSLPFCAHRVAAPGIALLALFGSANAQFQSVSAGLDHSLALRCDGTVEAWGNNDFGQCDVPPLPAGLTYVEVSAGGARADGYDSTYGLSVARRSDGSVVAWGDNIHGQHDVPALPAGLTYVEVAAGSLHALARRSDGSVVAWGDNTYGQRDVPALPAGLSYVQISAGGWNDEVTDWSLWGSYTATHPSHSVALRSDGVVVAWGSNSHGQTSVPPLPSGLEYVEVSAGSDHVVARRSDGSVVGWGDNSYGQLDVPALPAGVDYVAIEAGGGVTLALLSDGSMAVWGEPLPGLGPPATGHQLSQVSVGGASFRYTDINDLIVTTGAYPYAHAIERRGDGSLLGWGTDWYGQASVPAAPQASATPRNAGLNPISYSATDPILGTTWTASVDLTTTGHSLAALRGCTAVATQTLLGGQVLLVGGPVLFNLPPVAGPLASWTVTLPSDCAIAGFKVYTQAIHFGGVAPFALSNARDLCLGY